MDPLLFRLAHTVADAEGVEALTRPLLELLHGITGLESTYLTTVDEAAGLQHVRLSRNVGSLQIPEGIEVPWRDTLCKRAIDQQVPFTDDVPGLWGDSGAARELGITTYMTAPVESGNGKLLGTLCAASRDRKPVTAETHEVLGLFSRLIAQQLEREQLLQQLRTENAQLSADAATDPLTHLPNRRAVQTALAQRLAQAASAQRQVHVGFVDLDGFKAINDQHGHDVGDQFLRAMATRLASAMRPGDLVGRYGGDEFVVLFDAPADQGLTALHLRERLEGRTQGRFTLGDLTLDYAGASVGVVSSHPGETDVDALVGRADAEMYRQKTERKRAIA